MIITNQGKQQDIAVLIKNMASTINTEAELEYIFKFCKQHDFLDEPDDEQLQCLWTAYCLHTGLTPSDKEYGELARKIWKIASKEEDNVWNRYNKEPFTVFEQFMWFHLI